jgi:plastocyanin
MLNKYVRFFSVFVILALVPSIARAGEVVVSQSNKTFMVNGSKVEKLTIKAGDTIRFLNEDPWFHSIFSLSELKTFDLGSFPQGESRTVKFENPGQVDIECAVHPQMQLHLEVK